MKFLKVFSFVAIANLLKLISSFFVNKIFAVFLGPESFALLANIQNIISIYSRSTTGAIETGVVKEISVSVERAENYETVLNSTIATIYLILTVISIITLYFISELSNTLLWLSMDITGGLLIIILIAGPIFGISNIAMAYSNGLSRADVYSKANILGAVVTILIAYVFAKIFGLEGALLSLVIYQATIAFYIFFNKKISNVIQASKIKIRKFDKDIAKNLFHFSIMTATSVFTSSVLLLALRDIVASEYSLMIAGSWQSVWKLTSLSGAILISGISYYYLPKVSVNSDLKKYNSSFIYLLATLLPVFILAFIVTYYYNELIIELFFSSEFLSASQLLPLYVGGLLIQVFAWLFGTIVAVRKLIKWHLQIQVSSVLLTYILTVVLTGKYGLHGIAYAYVISNIYLLLANYVVLKRDEIRKEKRHA